MISQTFPSSFLNYVYHLFHTSQDGKSRYANTKLYTPDCADLSSR